VTGSVKLQVKPPTEVVGTAEQAVPPLQVTVTVDPRANPVPTNSNDEPTDPVAGAAVSWGTTVNEVPAELPAPSVPVKESAPAAAGGTVNAQRNEPTGLVFAVHAVPELPVTVTADVPAKPVPENVIDVPTVPVPGLTARVGRTVNVVLT